MSTPAFFPRFRAFDHTTGAPLAGGKLYTYVAGTSTPQATWQDASLATLNTNPVILDANGEANVFVGTLAYKFVLNDHNDVLQWSEDNVNYGSASPSIGGHNALINGSFEVWQAGTSFTGAATGFLADGWAMKITGTPTDYTISRRATLTTTPGQSLYGLRVQRNAAATSANGINIIQNIETADCGSFYNQYLTLSFWARTGANYSGGSNNLAADVFTGSGTDESYQTSGTLTDGLGVLSLVATPAQNQDWTYYLARSSSPILGNCNEVSLVLAVQGWSGTAGANDWIEVDDVKLEVGAIATPYERIPFSEDLRRAQRRYYKSFPYSVTPAQSAGTAGAYAFPQVVAGNVAMCTPNLPMPTWMRDVTGTITAYNPSAVTAQVRNSTVAADCTATAGVVSSNSAYLTLTSAAGGAAGNVCLIHYVIDKRF